MQTYTESSVYRAARIVMRMLSSGNDPFPIAAVKLVNGRDAVKFPRIQCVDEAVMEWKAGDPLNAYATLCSSIAAYMRGDEKPFVRFLSDEGLMRSLGELDDALRDRKILTSERS